MEDYVTFEQAVKLKELGFDWKCSHYYEGNYNVRLKESTQLSGEHYHVKDFYHNFNDFNSHHGQPGWPNCSAPTLSQAQKWLREKHKIHIQIEACMGNQWTYEIVDTEIRQDITGEYISRIPERDSYPLIDTYEQALSAGIDAALELLK